MEVPWGMINARREATVYKGQTGELQRRIDKAIKLLKQKTPNIELAIKVLEERQNK